MSHPRHQLVELLVTPVRLSIVAYLAGVDKAEFSAVRDAVEVSDSVLSRQATTLETAGLVRILKGHVGKRPRTWLSLTQAGRSAYRTHLGALRAIAGDAVEQRVHEPPSMTNPMTPPRRLGEPGPA